jgi:hypothetical protein
MNSVELVESFSEFKDFKNIDRPTMMRVLEDVFQNTYCVKNTAPTKILTSSSIQKKVTWKSGATV